MSGFIKFEEMFAQSIGLQDPWRIEKAEFSQQEQAVHIYVEARKTAKYACPACGDMLPRYDNEQERVWQHGDVVFFPCYVHCRRPRVKCPRCGKIHVVTPPWARERSRYTLLFEAYAMLLSERLPLEQARKFLRISHTSLTNIVSYWVNKRVAEDSLVDVFALCIDDTSFRRGQSYAEGIHSVIQAGKRKARGFGTFRGFSTMIYLQSAKLDFAPVLLFPSFSRS